MTLTSDGTTVYECRSAEDVVDLLYGAARAFGIAIAGAFKEIQGRLSEVPTRGASTADTEESEEAVIEKREAGPDEPAARRVQWHPADWGDWPVIGATPPANEIADPCRRRPPHGAPRGPRKRTR
jgi:hypothetical protein